MCSATGLATCGSAAKTVDAKSRVVAPGFVETPMTEWVRDEDRHLVPTWVPLGRFGTPADLAGVALDVLHRPRRVVGEVVVEEARDGLRGLDHRTAQVAVAVRPPPDAAAPTSPPGMRTPA